jgi:hypothetical protein
MTRQQISSGSRFEAGHRPDYSAYLVRRLREAGDSQPITRVDALADGLFEFFINVRPITTAAIIRANKNPPKAKSEKVNFLKLIFPPFCDLSFFLFDLCEGNPLTI